MTFAEQVTQVIGEMRPMLQSDGGDIEILNIDEASGKVTVRMQGACVGCSLSPVTLKMGIEAELKNRVPGFTEIVTEEEE